MMKIRIKIEISEGKNTSIFVTDYGNGEIKMDYGAYIKYYKASDNIKKILTLIKEIIR